MSEEVEFCPLCGSSNSVPFDQRSVHGKAVCNRLCARCGLVFQSPRMSAEELEAFYRDEYRQLYQGSQGPTEKDIKVQSMRASSLLSFAKGQVGKVSRHLDIGSSAGLLLATFREVYSTQPVGIEPGEAYREYAQARGLPAYASLKELESENPESFDLISMAHVLEHIPDPIEYLDHLRTGLLSPRGWLLIEVPNLYAHDCFEIAHLVSYSQHTLQQTVQKAGLEVQAFQQHGQPRSEIIPLYLTLLAKPGNTARQSYAVIPERGVGRKRRMGMLRRQFWTRLSPKRTWLPVSGAE